LGSAGCGGGVASESGGVGGGTGADVGPGEGGGAGVAVAVGVGVGLGGSEGQAMGVASGSAENWRLGPSTETASVSLLTITPYRTERAAQGATAVRERHCSPIRQMSAGSSCWSSDGPVTPGCSYQKTRSAT
jgi:hypothetical protein